MKVSIKDLNVYMEIKNRGVELEVRDPDGKHLGDLVVRKSGMVWCAGRTTVRNGVAVSWNQFLAWVGEQKR